MLREFVSVVTTIQLRECPACGGAIEVRRNVGQYEMNCLECRWDDTVFIPVQSTKIAKPKEKKLRQIR